MAIGNWLRTQGEEIPHVWRVLNRQGEVSEGWAPTDPSLPSSLEAVRERLIAEGVRFDARSRAAKSDLWGPRSRLRAVLPRRSTERSRCGASTDGPPTP